MVFKRSWAIEVAGQRPSRSASRRVGGAGALAGLLLKLRSGSSGMIKSALSMNRTLVGTSRCDVPARAVAGGTVAPLNAARTAQRAVPTHEPVCEILSRRDRVCQPRVARNELPWVTGRKYFQP